MGVTELEPTLTSLRETADRLDGIMEVSSPWVHAKLTPMLRDAADVIEGLESENASLRGAVEGFCDQNTKLRELLLDTLMHPREYCEKHGIEYAGWDSANAHVDARLRDLGIEVAE